jgi:hypothetical protein
MPAGRPTSYDPKFCEMLIDHMAKGYSFESFGSVTDTCKDTLYEWVKVHPEFSDSRKKALDKNRFWWETQAIENILNKKEMTRDKDGNTVLVETSINAPIWIFNMKNRFKEEWRDKQEIETTPPELTVRITGPEPPPEK